MKVFRVVFFFILVVLSVNVFAQRVPVPIIDFKDIPVAIYTNKILTIEQVDLAIYAAGEFEHWEITPAGDGVLSARLGKEGKHIVVVKISYSAGKYSVTYESSLNMKFASDASHVKAVMYKGPRAEITRYPEAEAIARQQALYKNDPETAMPLLKQQSSILTMKHGCVLWSRV
jgi:hypothetical protein